MSYIPTCPGTKVNGHSTDGLVHGTMCRQAIEDLPECMAQHYAVTAVQRLRRAFAEEGAVAHGEATEFAEAEAEGDGGYQVSAAVVPKRLKIFRIWFKDRQIAHLSCPKRKR
jgi:hypothetical protein